MGIWRRRGEERPCKEGRDSSLRCSPRLPTVQLLTEEPVIDGESEDVTPAAALVDESARG